MLRELLEFAALMRYELVNICHGLRSVQYDAGNSWRKVGDDATTIARALQLPNADSAISAFLLGARTSPTFQLIPLFRSIVSPFQIRVSGSSFCCSRFYTGGATLNCSSISLALRFTTVCRPTFLGKEVLVCSRPVLGPENSSAEQT